MKLILSEPKLLIDSITVISELVNEVQFKIDKDKITVIAMDPANVAMVAYTLLSSAFTEYQIEAPLVLSVSLDSLKAVLRRSKPSDTLKLEFDKEKNRLKIQIKGTSTRTFSLSLIDIEEKKQKIPELKFPLKIETPSAVFDESINDMDIISESVALAVKDGKFIVKAASNLSEARVEITADDHTTITSSSTEEVMSKYSLEYLKKIIKGSKLASKAVIQFSQNYPLKVEYTVQDRLSMQFILAPRVAND